MDNQFRAGYFTSSQMHRLCASLQSGKPSQAFKGYIEEVFAERLINRVSDVEVKTHATKWGSLMEVVLFNELGLTYEMTHKMTQTHPTHKDFWSGTPDLISKGVKIGEIKCYYPKNFALLSNCIIKQDYDLFKSEFPKEFWQCVSNAIIMGEKRAEIISFMPYRDELVEILKEIEESNFLERHKLEPNDYYFMRLENIESMPYLPRESKLPNINVFEFDIEQIDIDFLTERVLMAENEVKSLLEY